MQLWLETSLAHEKNLLRTNCKLRFPKSAMRNFHIPAGNHSFSADDIYNGVVPTKVFVTLVKAVHYNGTQLSNPFYFHPSEHLESISLYRDGTPIGLQNPRTVDLREYGENSMMTYMALQHCSGRGLLSEGLTFGHEQLSEGVYFEGFDLSPDADDSNDHVSPEASANISVSVKFREGTADPYELIIYSIFDSAIDITSTRAVIQPLVL